MATQNDCSWRNESYIEDKDYLFFPREFRKMEFADELYLFKGEVAFFSPCQCMTSAGFMLSGPMFLVGGGESGSLYDNIAFIVKNAHDVVSKIKYESCFVGVLRCHHDI